MPIAKLETASAEFTPYKNPMNNRYWLYKKFYLIKSLYPAAVKSTPFIIQRKSTLSNGLLLLVAFSKRKR